MIRLIKQILMQLKYFELDYFMKHSDYLNLLFSLEPYTCHYVSWHCVRNLVIGFMDGGSYVRDMVKTTFL